VLFTLVPARIMFATLVEPQMDVAVRDRKTSSNRSILSDSGLLDLSSRSNTEEVRGVWMLVKCAN
jgi:hypothetical protein